MLLVIALGFVINSTWHTGSVLGYATNISTTELLQDTNSQREANSLPDLAENSELDSAAQAKANDMVQQDYWAHVSPSGEQPWQFINDAGYSFVAAGENLAYGFNTGPAVIQGWMNSADHRANILDSSYKDVGFGFANSPNYQNEGEETVVVAEYAEPTPVAAPAPAKTTPAQTQPTQVAVTAPAPTTQSTQAQPVTPTQPTAAPKTTTSTPTAAQPATEQTVTNLPAQNVSRIDLFTQGNAQWATLAVTAIASISMIWFVTRHARLWRRYLVKGEVFAIKHPAFDTVLLSVAVLGVVLTRVVGVIR